MIAIHKPPAENSASELPEAASTTAPSLADAIKALEADAFCYPAYSIILNEDNPVYLAVPADDGTFTGETTLRVLRQAAAAPDLYTKGLALANAVKALGKNLAEFGTITDGEFFDAMFKAEDELRTALSRASGREGT